jgi:hypothetical protein
MNIYVVETTDDLLWLKLYSVGQIKTVFYDIVRSFERDDFPDTVRTLHIRYCMLEQGLENLPDTIQEVGFYHNMDNIEEIRVPRSVKILSFNVCVSQRLLDNIPAWITGIYIYYKSLAHHDYSNLPVGLEHIYFEFAETTPYKFELLPAAAMVVINKSRVW